VIAAFVGTMIDWIERSGKSGYKPKPDTATSRLPFGE